MNENYVSFAIGNKDKFNTLDKLSNTLYFCKDTKQLFKGDIPLTLGEFQNDKCAVFGANNGEILVDCNDLKGCFYTGASESCCSYDVTKKAIKFDIGEMDSDQYNTHTNIQILPPQVNGNQTQPYIYPYAKKIRVVFSVNNPDTVLEAKLYVGYQWLYSQSHTNKQDIGAKYNLPVSNTDEYKTYEFTATFDINDYTGTTFSENRDKLFFRLRPQNNDTIGVYYLKDLKIEIINTTTLLEIGNGQSIEAKSNAFMVFEDGHAELQTTGLSPKSLITKEYYDSHCMYGLFNSTSKLLEGSDTLLTELSLSPKFQRTMPREALMFKEEGNYTHFTIFSDILTLAALDNNNILKYIQLANGDSNIDFIAPEGNLNFNSGQNFNVNSHNIKITSSGIDMIGRTITNLKYPSNITDAATKQYVDNMLNSMGYDIDMGPNNDGYDTLAELQQLHPTGTVGIFYLIKNTDSSTSISNKFIEYFWDGTNYQQAGFFGGADPTVFMDYFGKVTDYDTITLAKDNLTFKKGDNNVLTISDKQLLVNSSIYEPTEDNSLITLGYGNSHYEKAWQIIKDDTTTTLLHSLNKVITEIRYQNAITRFEINLIPATELSERWFNLYIFTAGSDGTLTFGNTEAASISGQVNFPITKNYRYQVLVTYDGLSYIAQVLETGIDFNEEGI